MQALQVYTKKDGECKYCDKTLAFLRKYRIPYVVQALNGEELQAATGQKTWPQVYEGTAHIGGYDDVYAKYHEPVLEPNSTRYTLFPIQYPDIFELYEKSVASFWTVHELDLSRDRNDFDKLTSSEQHFLKHVLAFFASSDTIVADNLLENFLTEIQIAESRAFVLYQGFNESIHQHTYSLLIDTYIDDPVEKNHLFHAIQTVDSVKQKAEWAFRWMDANQPFSLRLIAFAIIEGVFFSGSFCAIFWLKKRGLMPGLSLSNVFISRDEGTHVQHATVLFSHLRNKPTQDIVHAILRDAVQHETQFIVDALPCSLIGMNSDHMTEYIQYVADHLLVSLGYEKIYRASNPFPFMELLSLENKTNFFENRVGEYQKSGVRAKKEDQTFATDGDF
jgi:ribonucleoside-diphosphate reductase beta chain